jgi:glycosyltransferase involved in cell wall biosynthesis
MNIKVAFLTLFSLREWGGVENWIFNMAQMLSEQHQVAVVSNGVTVKSRIQVIPPHKFTYCEIPTIALRFTKPSVIISLIPMWLRDFDVIYLYHNSFLHSCQVLNASKKPIVLGLHSELVFSVKSDIIRRLYHKAFYLMSTKASKIACRSRSQAFFLRNCVGIDKRRISLERPFVNTSLFKPSNFKDHFTLLFVGRLVKGKGLPTLQEAIKGGMKDERWILVGNGESQYESAIVEMIQKFPNVAWKHVLTGHELADEYARASVLVHPSESEAFPNVVLESLASGTPAILSDIPAHKEIAAMFPPETCSLFKCGDHNSLLKKIWEWKQLIRTDALRYNKICYESRHFVERTFSETNALKSFESLLLELRIKNQSQK